MSPTPGRPAAFEIGLHRIRIGWNRDGDIDRLSLLRGIKSPGRDFRSLSALLQSYEGRGQL